jgi:hypothetical protein
MATDVLRVLVEISVIVLVCVLVLRVGNTRTEGKQHRVVDVGTSNRLAAGRRFLASFLGWFGYYW